MVRRFRNTCVDSVSTTYGALHTGKVPKLKTMPEIQHIALIIEQKLVNVKDTCSSAPQQNCKFRLLYWQINKLFRTEIFISSSCSFIPKLVMIDPKIDTTFPPNYYIYVTFQIEQHFKLPYREIPIYIYIYPSGVIYDFSFYNLLAL